MCTMLEQNEPGVNKVVFAVMAYLAEPINYVIDSLGKLCQYSQSPISSQAKSLMQTPDFKRRTELNPKPKKDDADALTT